MGSTTVRKVTISLPISLLEFADQRAAKTNTSRSQVIGQALQEIKRLEEARLAAEGYQFYGKEAAEFSQASENMIAESWSYDGDWEDDR